MPSLKAYETPTNVFVVGDEVVLDGPDGVGLSMTPEAAAETGRRLCAAAEEALENRRRRRSRAGRAERRAPD